MFHDILERKIAVSTLKKQGVQKVENSGFFQRG